MKKLDQFDDRVWDRFFDFVTPDVEQMSISEVDAELRRAGIDIRPALARVNQALETRRARETLARARAERPSAIRRLAGTVLGQIDNARDRLESLIAARVPAAQRAVYLRKLEKVATDADVESLLEDLARLEELDRGGGVDEP
ncbi:MAG: hypothetical protein IPM64_17005 [Phycisphaerales bacterium]|nr:hypothetical protein [Phycisphaerales bacterium]